MTMHKPDCTARPCTCPWNQRSMIYPLALYGKGMHDFIIDELELGTKVAMALDDEAAGFGPLFDRMYMMDCEENEWRNNGPEEFGDFFGA